MTDIGNEHQVALAHKDVVERLWTAPVFESCGDALQVPASSSILVAEARCGYVPLRMVDTLPEDTRVIALDPSRAMLDQARQRFDESNQRRVFFVPQSVNALSYADDVFKASVCLNGVVTINQAEEALRELSRVTLPGGQVLLGVPLLNSFAAFYDLLDEALRAHQLHDVLGRMYELRNTMLTPGRICEVAETRGLHDVRIEEVSWDIAFENGHDLLFSPLIRETFFSHWIGVVRSSDREPILRYITDAVDTYWRDEELTCQVNAACMMAMR